MTTKRQEGIDEVLQAVAEFIANGNTLNADNFAEFAKSYDPVPNPYLAYSLDVLKVLVVECADRALSEKRIWAGDQLISYGEAYELVVQAIEYRNEVDFCKHGMFKHQEALCGYCEMGE